MIKAKASITLIRVDDGENGKGVLKTEVFYYLSTSNTTQSGGSWVTTPPSWVDGRYYWQKIKTTFTDNTTNESEPVCITGGKGQNGSAGSPGQSVTSITTQFYLSDSKETQTGGSWVELMPAWSIGKYLWTRSKIIYANPSATKYTAPICDSSWEAINDIDVGGRNYIYDGRFQKQNADRFWDFSGGGGSASFEMIENTGTPCVKIPFGSSGILSSYTTGGVIEGTENIIFNTGDTLTLSFLAKVTAENQVLNINFNGQGLDPIPLTTEWSKYIRTFIVIKPSPTALEFQIDRGPVSGNHLYLTDVKLERGNKATDWTPAPEDMASSEQLSDTLAQFDVLKNMISSLVTDENGSSLMTQTSDGWTFNMSAITDKIDEAVSSLQSLEDNVNNVETLANNVGELVDDITKKTAYITLSTDDNANPCIELGKENNPFKVRITNTAIDFIDNGVVVAYVNNKSMYIESAVIKNELKIGDGVGFIWKKRSNGNLGLRYSG